MDALAGLVAVVTQGGSERGAAIAAAIASHGATVVLYDAEAERTDAAAAQIRHGWGTTAIQIGDPMAPDQAGVVADVVRTCGGLDALILLLDERGLAEDLIEAALPRITARSQGLIVLVDPSGERPQIGKLEEALSAIRSRLGTEASGDVRCYGVASLPPGGDLGPAIAHLALTRPDEELDGRVVVVPPV
jgi:NAD(P)-dependent dehydrogenase (short-subunit alcohol dehydrogenase family)